MAIREEKIEAMKVLLEKLETGSFTPVSIPKAHDINWSYDLVVRFDERIRQMANIPVAAGV